MPDDTAFATAHVPLTVVTRGAAVESVHMGSVAVVDRDGALLFAAGDPEVLTFTRSALKPLQALPFVAAGGVERYGLAPPEVALLCASHAGEPRHVEAAAAILAKAGNSAADLQCGAHPPYHYQMRGEVPPPPPYSPLAHNCSGKHAGMLAHCSACGYAKGDYLDPGHPLQREIRRAVATFTGVADDALVMGIDGCSAPNYAVPLHNLARAFARLATAGDDPAYGRAPRTLAEAMTAHPGMVSGEGGSDLALMEAGRGDWLTKIGAEGVQAIGVRSRGWGIAVKVADGAARGLHPATVAALDQLGLLDEAARASLARWGRPAVRNYRGIVTGEVGAVVVLDKPSGRLQATTAGRSQ
ncbi:MAG: asparaginase [Burkholderiales bacterium]